MLAIVCAAENMPDGKAYKPGDVVTAMPLGDRPGKAIDVINTGAVTASNRASAGSWLSRVVNENALA